MTGTDGRTNRRGAAARAAGAALLGACLLLASPLPGARAGGRAAASPPLVVTDPSTGGSIALYTRSDGTSLKIAWARLEGGAWRDAHDVTFGAGDDLSPVVGTSLIGTTLFWRTDAGRVFYAPFDVASGRLFAVPRPLEVRRAAAAPAPATGLSAPTTPSAPSHGVGIEGGTDIPVILRNCSATVGPPCIGPGGVTPLPTGGGLLAPEGGSDVPVVLSTPSTAVGPLAVASSSACAHEPVAIVSRDGASFVVVDFTGSPRPLVLGRYAPDHGVRLSDALTAADAYFLRSLCR